MDFHRPFTRDTSDSHRTDHGVRSTGMKTTDTILTHENVASRAYAIWESEGRLDGNSFDHWLRAERELRESGNGRSTPASPSSAGGDNARRAATRQGAGSSAR